MNLRTSAVATASALAIAICTGGVAQADDVPPPFQNRPTAAVCYNAVPTIVGAGVILGGPGADVIVGSNGPDEIFGFGANDIILGLGANDIIHGGQGDGQLGFDYCTPSTEVTLSCV